MCLTEIKRGETVSLLRIDDEETRTQFIRLGISAGSRIKCLEKIPFGPLMLSHNNQEIAIGREAARRVIVEKGGRQ
jgi:ferrous iron transport protein A